MNERKTSESPARGGKMAILRRWRRLAAISLALLIGLVGIWRWEPSLIDMFIDHPAFHRLRLYFFRGLYVGYLGAALLAPLTMVVSIAVGLMARKRGQRRLAARTGRAMLLSMSLLIAIGLSEIICAWQIRGDARLVRLPAILAEKEGPRPAPRPESRQPDESPLRQPPTEQAPEGTHDIVIIGESSAKGVPFHTRMSLDRIIAWQLGRAMPEKKFRSVNLAEGGHSLKLAIEELVRLERRPGLLIVYSGHNEFQARFGWQRNAPHYRIESKISPPTLNQRIRAVSATAAYLGTSLDRFNAEFAPRPRKPEADPADSPCCTPAEYADTLEDYRRRLDGLLGDCESAGIPTMVIVSPSNEGAFDPNRSILSPDTSLADQRDFMKRLDEVRRTATADPTKAMADYRHLIAEQPGFAETHYRLAQLLETAGSYEEAREEYIRARDLDGLPFRCQTPFLEACREVGRRHHSIVVDAPRLLASASPHGILNDRLFNDAHHPALNSFVIMARDAIRQLKERRTFDWPDSSPTPTFTMADCIRHFNLDWLLWYTVCDGSQRFYYSTEILPRDPSWRKSVKARYGEAMQMMKDRKSPDDTGIPALRTCEELRAVEGADVAPGSPSQGPAAASQVDRNSG